MSTYHIALFEAENGANPYNKTYVEPGMAAHVMTQPILMRTSMDTDDVIETARIAISDRPFNVMNCVEFEPGVNSRILSYSKSVPVSGLFGRYVQAPMPTADFAAYKQQVIDAGGVLFGYDKAIHYPNGMFYGTHRWVPGGTEDSVFTFIDLGGMVFSHETFGYEIQGQKLTGHIKVASHLQPNGWVGLVTELPFAEWPWPADAPLPDVTPITEVVVLGDGTDAPGTVVPPIVAPSDDKSSDTVKFVVIAGLAVAGIYLVASRA